MQGVDEGEEAGSARRAAVAQPRTFLDRKEDR